MIQAPLHISNDAPPRLARQVHLASNPCIHKGLEHPIVAHAYAEFLVGMSDNSPLHGDLHILIVALLNAVIDQHKIYFEVEFFASTIGGLNPQLCDCNFHNAAILVPR
jgi:hypothetical protein